MNKKEIVSIYEELRGILTSIGDEKSWFDDDGFTGHANHIIERVGLLCPEISDIGLYLIQTKYQRDRGEIVESIPAKAKLNSLIGRLKGLYDIDARAVNSGHIFIQNQQMNIELLLDVRGQIEKNLENYKPEQPERQFLEKLKEKLSTARSAMDVIRLIISTAKEFGISLVALMKIFGI